MQLSIVHSIYRAKPAVMKTDFEDYLETEVFDEKDTLIGLLNCFWTDDDDQPQFLGIKLKRAPDRSSVVPVTIATADERHSCIRIQATFKDILTAPRSTVTKL